MTRDETIKVLAIIKAAYPASYRNMTKEEANGTVAVWSAQFSELPAVVVMIAVNKLIATNTFPPSISEVKSKITGIYWEATEKLMLNANGCIKIDAKTLETYKTIKKACEPLQTEKEPSLSSLIPAYQNYLTDGSKS